MGFQHCVLSLCSSSYSDLGLQLLIDMLPLKNSSYWLVRTELLDTLAEIDFRLVSFLEAKAESLHRGAHHYTGVSSSFCETVGPYLLETF